MMLTCKRYIFSFYFLIGIIFLISSCTGTRKLPEQSLLYDGAEIQLSTDLPGKKEKDLRLELNELIQPTPNGKFLWMRPGLSIYNAIKEPKKKKGLKNWLKYKIGEPPVLYESDVPEKILNRLTNNLFHQGFFNAKGEFEIRKKRKSVFVTYTLYPGTAHVIDSLIIPGDSSALSKALQNHQQETLIQKGDNYNLEVLKNERIRLNNEIHNHGFYFFDSEFLYFNADTARVKNKVDLTLKVKPNNTRQVFQPYSLSNVYVLDDFQLKEDLERDTTLINGYYYLSNKHDIRPEIVLDEIFLYDGQLYNKRRHDRTINYLMSLGNYRFVNIQYGNENDIDKTIDATIYLTPHKKYSLSAEFNTVAKSNNYFGPGVRFNFLNRNFLGGSEILNTNLNVGYDWQSGNDNFRNTSLELSLESSLIFPRIVPFKQKKETKQYLANSRISAGIGYFNRVNLYKFLTFSGAFKYSWVKRPRIIHEFSPIDVSVNNLLETTETFNNYLEQNPSVRRSLEEQFILGSTYNFTYDAVKDKNFLYTGGLDLAGNLLSLFGYATGKSPNQETPNDIFGIPYSQFVRIKNEFRYQLKVSEEHAIATRLIASVGIPYGNSTVLPYVRQFFSGGSNSIRAFRARSIGPGSYIPSDTSSFFLVDQSGDLKFEYNMEYRFPIARYIKGALFIDMGNIWLINDDPNRPGGVFKPENFLKELAIGTGYGLRADFDILVIRFDWAFPLREPYLEKGNRWNEIRFFDSKWRRDNIILNISIGYPF